MLFITHAKQDKKFKIQTLHYYTKELKSILFTQYGFAVFNFNTKYYYNVTNDGVVIYLQDVDNPLANKYGFVEENFGSFDNVKDYKGDTYYQNDGFAITFTRKEETKIQKY